MPRNLSNGFVFKDERSGHWRAAISWQDEDFLREWRDEEVRKEEEESRGTVSCETPVYRYVLDYIDMKESTGNILTSLAPSSGRPPWGRSPRGRSRSSSATWCRTATAGTPSRTPTCC